MCLEFVIQTELPMPSSSFPFKKKLECHSFWLLKLIHDIFIYVCSSEEKIGKDKFTPRCDAHRCFTFYWNYQWQYPDFIAFVMKKAILVKIQIIWKTFITINKTQLQTVLFAETIRRKCITSNNFIEFVLNRVQQR